MSAIPFNSATVMQGVDKIVGVSAWSNRIRSEIRQVSQHQCNVLVVGPTGTGKEVIARAIHEESSRRDAAFVPVDCAAIVESLFESHMFGHVKGAFTGAQNTSKGCFRSADGGTIFLDELGELDLTMQAKLLRVLEERVVIPVGQVEGISVSVRIIAATNRDLEKMVAEGTFRQDLYYRLNVVKLQTEALSDRPDDIECLSRALLRKLSDAYGIPRKRLASESIEQLCGQKWPGNVRQLENILERAIVFASGDLIEPASLNQVWDHDESDCHDSGGRPKNHNGNNNRLMPVFDRGAALETYSGLESSPAPDPATGNDETDWISLDAVQRNHIQQTLEHTSFNQSKAARLLGISRRVLQRLIRQLDLEITKTPAPIMHQGG